MSKLDDAAAAIDSVLGDDHESLSIEMGTGPEAKKLRADAMKEAARAVLMAIRTPTNIYPHQLTAWQGIIDGILKDGK